MISFHESSININDDTLMLFEINLNNQFDINTYIAKLDNLRNEMDLYLKDLKDSDNTIRDSILNDTENYKNESIKVILIKHLTSNSICGYVTCCPASYDDTELILIEIYFDQNNRNKNYSERIFKMLTTIAKKYNFTSMTLNVSAANIPAIKAYTKAGYRPTFYYMKKDL